MSKLNEPLNRWLVSTEVKELATIKLGESFEPICIPYSFAGNGRRWSRIRARQSGLIFALPIFVVVMIGNFNRYAPWFAILVWAMIIRGWRWVRPVYLRAVPGRVDTLYFWFWNTIADHAETLDVRNNRVRFSPLNGLVYVRPRDPGERVRVITLAPFFDWEHVYRAVELAAASAAETPTLPMDRLIG